MVLKCTCILGGVTVSYAYEHNDILKEPARNLLHRQVASNMDLSRQQPAPVVDSTTEEQHSLWLVNDPL